MDFKSAFLNGILKEEAFVKQPPGFENSKYPNHVYKLNRALYGLKQAPRAWYDRLTTYLLKNGFKRGSVDKTLFVLKTDEGLLFVQIYVDDLVFCATVEKLKNDFVQNMSKEFEMSLVGELNYFLGLQVKQSVKGLFISQSKYALDLIKKFDLEKSKTHATPIPTTIKLSKDESGIAVPETLYRSMIGSLLYLTASRPDICFAVGLCARYQSAPKESHLKAVKRIIRYVAGTTNLGLWYPKETNTFLAGYSDADWAGNVDDRKSTSGNCFYIGNCLISWSSKKQSSVSLSTAEAEYIAAGRACTQLLWMKQMLLDYGICNVDPLHIFCDSTSAINISKNPVQHSRTKHIDIRHHFIRDLVEDKVIVLDHVSSNKNLADIFTKPLDTNRFNSLISDIGMINI